MGNVQHQILPAREVERLREEAKIAKPLKEVVNTNFGYGVACVAEMFRPQLHPYWMKAMFAAGFISIGFSAKYSAVQKRAEFADWHGTYRRLEMGQIWSQEFVTNSFGQIIIPCFITKYVVKNAVLKVKRQDRWTKRVTPPLVGFAFYTLFGYPFYRFCWKPFMDKTLGAGLEKWKVFLMTEDGIERRPGVRF